MEYLENGAPVLVVTGADMMDGTPVFDIKPYVPFADSHPEAKGGFTDQTKEYGLAVEIPEEFLEFLPEEKRDPLRAVLAQDPPPVLPGGSGPGLWHGICRIWGEVYRVGEGSPCEKCGEMYCLSSAEK